MRPNSTCPDRSPARGRRSLGARIALAFAALWLLRACGELKQPPFEVRNELDQLVVDFYTPPEGETFRETVAKREERGGIVGATGQFLRDAFPPSTPVNTITEYFEGIGGTCRTMGIEGDSSICEYCRNRNWAWRYIIDTSYGKLEILWIVEIFGIADSGSTDRTLVTSALAYTVAKSGSFQGGSSGPASVPNTCDTARSRLENRKYDKGDPQLMRRQWAFRSGD